MEINVSLRGPCCNKLKQLQSRLERSSCATRISASLADRLRLERTWVKIWYGEELQTMKISLSQLTVHYKGVTFHCYPIIGSQKYEADLDLVLGDDFCSKYQNLLPVGTVDWDDDYNSDLGSISNPSHAYSETIPYCWPSYEDIPPNRNEFLEFWPIKSNAVFRLAINRSTRQLIVIYRNNQKIYRYSSVSKFLEKTIVDAYYYGSLGSLMAEVKDNRCPCSIIDQFPTTVLFRKEMI